MKLLNIVLIFAVSILLASTAIAQTTVTLTSSTGEVILTDGQILTGTGGTETHVTIADGATVTLNGVTISGSSSVDNSHKWAGITCAGDATIILADGTTNIVEGREHRYAGIFIPKNHTLTIKGGGTLNAKSLQYVVNNIHQSGAAGIGANSYTDCGNIVIEGGIITATGSRGSAGIGSTDSKSCGDITISGGTITATGGQGGNSGAGIGSSSGESSSCGDILISGGTVTAIGGYAAAGIGTGSGDNITTPSKCGNITITGGTINATKGEYATHSIGGGSKKGNSDMYSIGKVTIGGVEGAISKSPYTVTVVPSTYTVKYHANGGTGDMGSQSINVGIATPLSRNSFTRNGYAFIGWSNTADGDVAYTNGQSVTDLAAANGTKTLYAKWMSTADFPTGIQVDADFIETQTGFFYVNMPINAATTIVRINDFKYYPFKIYDDGGKNGDATSGANGNLTIYSPSGYNVNLTGKVEGKKGWLTVYDGSDENATSLGEFNSNSNISVSSAGSSITLHFATLADAILKGLNITATTSIINYTITYAGIDGATIPAPNPTSYTVETESFTLNNPSKDGYTFIGWTYEGHPTPNTSLTIPKGSTGNIVFTANWKQVYGALTLYYWGDVITASIQGDFSATESGFLKINSDINVNQVTFNRSFTKGVPATVMFPFSFAADAVNGKFYTLASVAPENGVWTAKMSETPIKGTIEANTPYIFKANSNLQKLTFENGTDGFTLQSTDDIKENANGDWTLHGVYTKTPLDAAGAINYGFAGQAKDGISVGQFIRAGEGVWADPMRCYLTYKNGALTKSALDLPDYIRVVFPDEVEQPDNGEIITTVSAISETSGAKVWSYNGTIYIEAQPDMDYTIVDLSGRVIKTGVTHTTREEVTLGKSTGIVIVKIAGKIYKLSL